MMENKNMNLPIIRLEIDHMKQSLWVALSEYSTQMDENLKEAINEFCTPENIKRIITETANKVMAQTIKEEVTKFFIHNGEGRKVIAQAVKEKLLNNETYTPLDEDVT